MLEVEREREGHIPNRKQTGAEHLYAKANRSVTASNTGEILVEVSQRGGDGCQGKK